jgi:hypothetical protein
MLALGQLNEAYNISQLFFLLKKKMQSRCLRSFNLITSVAGFFKLSEI